MKIKESYKKQIKNIIRNKIYQPKVRVRGSSESQKILIKI